MSLPATTLASVQTGRRRLELRELPLPPVSPDSGLLRVEATGVCGSDVIFYEQDAGPRILGHEVVGTVAALGATAADRWGVREGDRVVLEEYLPCGHCSFCRSSEYRLCPAADPSVTPGALRYGNTDLKIPPGLWGGYSEYMYLHPRTVAHKLGPAVPATLASMALPLANGFEWAVREGGAGLGSVVLVIGPGQQGLGCVIAAKRAGAACVIVTGLPRDARRLEVARQLGADHTLIAGEGPGLAAQVTELLGGEQPGIVIDTAAGSEATIPGALDVVGKRGVIVVPASVRRPLRELDFYKITRKYLTVKGVRGHSFQAVEWAMGLIDAGLPGILAMSSLDVGLADVDAAIRGTGGELDQPVIHATVTPGRPA
ncbi:MAG TPA: zinc-binding dehydrogenase [Trebonia sp.]|jgi:threonine dehydrogenase-like Zn-dependent dehydrogenase